MKALHLFILAAALAVLPAASNAASLIALWDFDGDYLTANTNTPYDLTPGGGVSIVCSPRGMAAEFHGGTYPIVPPTFSNPALDRLDTTATTNNASFNGGLSIMGWVKPYPSSDDGPVLSHDSSAYSLDDLGFQVFVGSTVQLQLRDNTGQFLIALANGNPLTPNQWYHVAATWDGSTSDGFALYIDGQAVPYHIITAGGFQGLNGSNPLPIRIGAHLGNSVQEVKAFDGAIDHLSLHSGALTAAEVQADYLATVSVSVNVGVEGNGTVTKYPDQVSYTNGQTVTLTAVPGNCFWAFSLWSDGDTNNPRVVTAGLSNCLEAVFTLLGIPLITTFTNPTPAVSDRFGYWVAAVGGDRVLIGAYHDDTGATDAGAAYLFSINGTLLTTFTNPTPAAGDEFGISVAAVGDDRLLIGARYVDTGATDAGVAYLFSINGTLLTIFTNPTPAFNDEFGFSVAGVGSEHVLIGALGDDTGAINAGAAYLFNTNGALVTTLTNPAPAAGEGFGESVAAVGGDCVLIGAYSDSTGAADAGAAFLFSTNGTLLTTFTNPTPAVGDLFGFRVAGFGNDRVLISAVDDDTGAEDSGAAYLFSTNGTLLTTFVNPTPEEFDRFGHDVAAVGSDKVLIGAYGDSTGAMGAGAAYLFSTNGTLLATITNPAPASSDWFGVSVEAVENELVLISAFQDDTGATDAGAAYLISLGEFSPVPIKVLVEGNGIVTTNPPQALYTNCQIVTLTAIEGNCLWRFSHWSDGNTNNPRTITVGLSNCYTAVFTNLLPATFQNTKLAFTSNRDGNSEIYVMNPDGTQQVRLTTHPAADDSAAWSPDGTRIALASNRNGSGQIYVMNSDGTNPTNLTDFPEGAAYPAWSPDGKRIAFVSGDGSSSEIYVMNADGSNPSRLTTNGVSDYQPRWSPDGLKLVLRRSGSFCCNLWMINADGSGESQLTSTDDGGAAWSPDGTNIVFHSDVPRNGSAQIFIINTNGSNRQQLTSVGERNYSPAWSPDGIKIAFTSDRDGNAEIYVMNADGSSQTRVTTNVFSDDGVDWSRAAMLLALPPTIVCPSNITANCAGTNGTPVPFAASAMDACGTNLAVVCIPASGTFFARGTTIVDCAAVDARGLSNTCSFTVTVADTNAPTLVSCPADETISCPATPVFGTPVFADSCDTNLTVTFADTTLPALCPAVSVVKRTWMATDDSGNLATCSQTITVVDTNAPTLTCVADKTAACRSAWTFDEPTASDVCGTVTVSIVSTVTNAGPCGGTFTATRMWKASDACTNEAMCSQTVTVVDTTQPSITCPVQAKVDCNSSTDPGVTGRPTATDNCDPSPTVTYSDSLAGGPCPGSSLITRTWTATDCSSNVATCLQTITVVNPAAVTCPCVGPDIISWWKGENNGVDSIDGNHGTLQNGIGFAAGQVGQAFSFDGVNDYVRVSDSASLRPASLTIEGWFRFSLATSLQVLVSKTLGSGILDSYQLVFDNGVLRASIADTNGFGPIVIIPFTPVLGQWYHFAFTFDDATGAEALFVNSVLVDSDSTTKSIAYDTHPVLLGADTDYEVIQFFFKGLMDEVTLYGRALSATEILAIYAAGSAGKDVTAPLVVSCPSDATIECPAAPAFGTPVFADNCDTNLTVTFIDTTLPAVCPAVSKVKRTWTASDDCGNAVTCSQTISVEDHAAPSLTCVTSKTAECGTAWAFDAPTASDTCGTVTVSIVSTVTNTVGFCANAFAATRTWRAIDACNNQSQPCGQTVMVVDTTPPSFTTCPANVNLGCNPANILACNAANAVATDNCGTPMVTCGSVDGPVVGCVRYRTNVYTATDACNNMTTCRQVLSWAQDTTPPSFTTCPTNINLGCNPASIPPCNTTNAVATDNCGTPTVTCASFDGPVVGCVKYRTNVYTATDACNNTATCHQVLSWTEDTTPPTIACPTNMTVLCTGTNGAVVIFSATATDNCDPSLVPTCIPPSGSVFHEGTNVVTCVAMDDCGNTNTCAFVIRVDDPAGPPTLNIARQGGTVALCWPVSCANYELQQTPVLPVVLWTPAGGAITITGSQYCVTLPIISSNQFFRLKKL